MPSQNMITSPLALDMCVFIQRIHQIFLENFPFPWEYALIFHTYFKANTLTRFTKFFKVDNVQHISNHIFCTPAFLF